MDNEERRKIFESPVTKAQRELTAALAKEHPELLAQMEAALKTPGAEKLPWMASVVKEAKK